MAFLITVNESNASRRCVPIWLVGSNGTTPATGESGSTFHFSIGGFHYGSGGSLSVVSGAAGEYVCAFKASILSIVGPGTVYYQSGSAIASSTPFQVTPIDSYDSMRLGLFALPNAAAEAAGGLITRGAGTGQLNISSGSVGLQAVTHSGVTISGIQSIQSGTYSGVTFGVNAIAPNSYSGVTLDGVAFLSAAGARSVASSLLSTNLGNSRLFQDGWRMLRNRVLISGSTGTVYQEDDSTSAWTFSITTSANASPIIGFDPAG